MTTITQQIKEAKDMLQSVESHISDKTYQEIEVRIDSWTKGMQVSNKANSKSLPPLVMSSGGIPKPINPLFFKLKT